MTNTLLDFSLRPELALHARVVAEVEAAAGAVGVTPLIAGAFARDLHLQYGHGIDIQRQTEDIDFALAVPDWAAFAVLHERLIASGAFAGSTTAAHRLRHHSGWPVDLVPFGGVESPERKIAGRRVKSLPRTCWVFVRRWQLRTWPCCQAMCGLEWCRFLRSPCSKLFAGKTGTTPLHARMHKICR